MERFVGLDLVTHAAASCDLGATARRLDQAAGGWRYDHGLEGGVLVGREWVDFGDPVGRLAPGVPRPLP
ncbi:hypothetical protein LA76x_3880 [Lysobacter antibioticus]|uniref:Uncharacterized protein n=1 Tax=Lysobacter antibioticus TaxID=84531 RepID=A0A0S2FEP0_LYSAN|nr:hypothetical protein LA76x_3880 [Lysobacter antibioticus]